MANIDPTKPEQNRGRLMAIFIVAALFAIGIFQVLTGNSGFVTTEIDQERLGVCGTYGGAVFVDLDAITEVQLVDTFSFGTCLEGKEAGSTVSGIYTNETLGQYTVHAYTNVPAYILVTHPGGTLVFNCNTASRTEDFYNQLTAREAQ